MERAKKTKFSAAFFPIGFLVGLLSGLFGAGGGIVAIPLLKKLGLAQEEAHATCIAIILPLSLASGWLYLIGGHFNIKDILPYLPGGIVGAVVGGLLLPKLDSKILRKIFGLVIIFCAVRMIMR